MLKNVLFVVVGLLVAVCAFIATRPAEFQVTRSVVMAASPEVVQAQVVDFHKWDAWSPWAKLDPNIKTTFNGAESGVGAEYSWIGNDDVGEGKMTVTAVKPNEQVNVSLEFLKPFASKADVAIATRVEGEGTQVTWTMSGHNDFLGKAMSAVMDMDAMLGKDFEKGLAQLKTVSEAEAKKLAEAKAAAEAAAMAEAPAADGAEGAEGEAGEATAQTATP